MDYWRYCGEGNYLWCLSSNIPNAIHSFYTAVLIYIQQCLLEIFIFVAPAPQILLFILLCKTREEATFLFSSRMLKQENKSSSNNPVFALHGHLFTQFLHFSLLVFVFFLQLTPEHFQKQMLERYQKSDPANNNDSEVTKAWDELMLQVITLKSH